MSRPRVCPDDTLLLVVQMRRAQWTVRGICESLNATKVPTPGGKPRWWPSYVTRLLQTAAGARLLAAEDPAAELAAIIGGAPTETPVGARRSSAVGGDGQGEQARTPIGPRRYADHPVHHARPAAPSPRVGKTRGQELDGRHATRLGIEERAVVVVLRRPTQASYEPPQQLAGDGSGSVTQLGGHRLRRLDVRASGERVLGQQPLETGNSHGPDPPAAVPKVSPRSAAMSTAWFCARVSGSGANCMIDLGGMSRCPAV